MRPSTVAGLSVLGMLLTSFVTAWLTGPKPTAAAATLDAPKRVEKPASIARVRLPGALELDARLGHEVVAADQPNETFLLFRTAAQRTETAGQRPLHIALLIDRSGSMRGRRLANALDAARGLVGRLRDRDRLTVMAYDSKVERLLSSVVEGAESKRDIARRIEVASARGSTCISCALEAGIEALEGSDARAGVNHVVLLTDGEATAGIKGLEGFRELARRAREKGIGVSSIGIDVDYNEALLTTLARFSNGRHHFVRDPGDLDRAFDRELGELAGTAATEATLEIELASGVEVLEVFDREVERGPGRLRARLGSFAAAEEKTLLVKLRLPAGGPRLVNVADFSLSYRASAEPGVLSTSKSSVGVRASDQKHELSELDPAVFARVGRSRTGALLSEAGRLFKTGEPSDFAALEQKLEKELARIDSDRQRVRPRASGAASKASRDLDEQGKAIQRTREILRTTRGARCGCAPADLMCAMTCASGVPSNAAKKPRTGCPAGDPLCADVGADLSSDEKAAAKESAGSADKFTK